jgi:hypothetical protein
MSSGVGVLMPATPTHTGTSVPGQKQEARRESWPMRPDRQVVEKKLVELEARGIITFEDDPGDTRKKLISRAHVNAVIAALTR